MNGFIAFYKKEWLEAIRTKRLLIVLITFAILGILAPLITLLTPSIMEMSFSEGVVIQIPDPTAIDAFASFFKNISQMGTVVLLLLFSGTLANDVKNQALIPLLTKGLSRSSVILAKLTVNYLLWTISYLLCFVIAFSYTMHYWDISTLNHIALSVAGVWLCGIFLITLLVLFSTFFLSYIGALIGTAAVIAILLILPIFEATNRYNPLQLFSQAIPLLTASSVADIYWNIAITLIIVVASVFISIMTFNKKHI